MTRTEQTDMSTYAGPAASYDRSSFHGATLLVTARIVGHVVQLGALVVIARLLTPDDFGVMAMVVAVTALFSIFRDLGLSLVTVQRPNITQDELSILFWVNVAFGCFLGLLTFGSGPILGWFYRDVRLAGVTAVIAITFPLGALGVQHEALLKRNMQFGRFVAQRFACTVASATSGVYMAYIGWGYWALAYQQVVSIGISTILLWLIVRWRPGPPRRCDSLKEMLGFGGRLSAHGLIGYFSMNLDKLLIGRFFGSAALGLYAAAYRLMMRPIAIAAFTVGDAAIPAMSRDAEAGRTINDSYYRMLRFTCLLGFPVCVWGCIWAEDVVMALLGSQWMQITTILRFLLVAALANMVGATTGWVFVAAGHPGRMLRWGVAWTGITAVAFCCGLPFRAEGVAAAYAAANWLSLPVWLHYAYRPTTIRSTQALRIASRALLYAVLSTVPSTLAAWVFPSTLDSATLKFSLQILGAALCYAAVILTVVRPARDSVRNTFARLMPSGFCQEALTVRTHGRQRGHK